MADIAETWTNFIGTNECNAGTWTLETCIFTN